MTSFAYSNADGTGAFQGSAFGSVQVNNNTPTVIQPLDYAQAHKGTFNLDYRFGKDDGGPILEQLGINLLFTFNSGHPYTPATPQGLGQNSAWQGALSTDTRQRRPVGPINSANTPWNYNLDMRIDKTVALFDKLDVNLYIVVTNVFNTQNVINVYNVTGNAYDDGFLRTNDGVGLVTNPVYTQRYADLYRSLNLENREHSLSQLGLDVFGLPRQMRAGVLINF